MESTLPSQHSQLESTGRLANFRRASGQETGPHEGLYFNDSDVYKWIEACAYGLAIHESPSLRASMDSAIDAVAACQEEDGYINTFFQLKHPDLKYVSLGSMHEMYCGGHLIEAGVAEYLWLGQRRLLDVAVRYADHLASIFGPGKRRGYCGHEEIELALVRLSDAVGDPKYRDLARWMVEERGHRPSPFLEELNHTKALELAPWAMGLLGKEGTYSGEYAQDHAPIREHTEVVGHAVRAMYLYAAAADLAGDPGDPEMARALEAVWTNLTRRRMYVSGGIGPSSRNEGFTTDFDLPNLTAYAETCAAIGLIFWGQKMLEMTGNSEYADVIERALYNGALSGISLEGDKYFYVNPLESRGESERKDWFACACCPPNLARLIGNLSSFVAAEAEGDFYIHQFAGFEAESKLSGVETKITAESNFPWDGAVKIRVEPTKPVTFALHVRVPDWSDDLSTELPGAKEEAEYENGYAVFRRTWSPGDMLILDLGLEPKWIESDPRVRENLGRTALTRGPLVYCAEANDSGWAPQLFTADTEVPPVEESEPILGGVVTLLAEGVAEIEEFSDSLYDAQGTTSVEEAELKFIPYYAWNNRGATDMQVWVRGM